MCCRRPLQTAAGAENVGSGCSEALAPSATDVVPSEPMEQDTQEAGCTPGQSAGCGCLRLLPPVPHVSRRDRAFSRLSDSPLILLLAFAVITAAVAKSTAWLNLPVWVFCAVINNSEHSWKPLYRKLANAAKPGPSVSPVSWYGHKQSHKQTFTCYMFLIRKKKAFSHWPYGLRLCLEILAGNKTPEIQSRLRTLPLM